MKDISFVRVGDTLTTTIDGEPISFKILDIALGTSETWGALITIQHSNSKEPSSVSLSNFREWMKQSEWQVT